MSPNSLLVARTKVSVVVSVTWKLPPPGRGGEAVGAPAHGYPHSRADTAVVRFDGHQSDGAGGGQEGLLCCQPAML